VLAPSRGPGRGPGGAVGAPEAPPNWFSGVIVRVGASGARRGGDQRGPRTPTQSVCPWSPWAAWRLAGVAAEIAVTGGRGAVTGTAPWSPVGC